MALITADDVSVQTGVTYTGDDLARVNSFIENVSDSIEAYCRRTFTPPVPGAVRAVAIMEVRRLLNIEPGISVERIGDLNTGYAHDSGSAGTEILSDASKESLDAYMRWISQRVWSIRVVSPLGTPGLIPPTLEVAEAITWPDPVVVTGTTPYECLVEVQMSTDGWTWTQQAIVESAYRDDRAPRWRYQLDPMPTQDMSLMWRARYRWDGELSPWSSIRRVRFDY